MKKTECIALLSLFVMVTVNAAAVGDEGDQLAPLALAATSPKSSKRAPRLSPLTPDTGLGLKRVPSVPKMGKEGETLIFTFGQPDEGLRKGKQDELSRPDATEVHIQTTEKITDQIVFTGEREGKPFILVLAQSENDGAGNNLLIVDADSSSGNGHASSFLPGSYKGHVVHEEGDYKGGVTVTMCLRLGDHEQERAVTFDGEGNIVKDEFVKNPCADLIPREGMLEKAE